MTQVLATLCWLLLLGILAAQDLREFRLPLGANLAFVLTGLAVGDLAFGVALPDRLIGAGTGYAGLQAVALAYRAIRGRVGIGGGDPILLAGLGAWFGWQPLSLVVLIAALLGIVAAALVFAIGPRAQQPWQLYRLPLGTLLAASSLIVAAIGR